MLYNTLLRITPKTLKSVDVYPPSRKILPMIDLKMTITTKHKGIIAFKFISIDNASPSHFFNSQIQHRLRSNIGDDLNEGSPLTLQDTENRDFSGCPSPPISFSSATKVGLINLYFTPKQHLRIFRVSHNRKTNSSNRLINSVIRQSHLDADLPCGKFQFKELDDSQPLTTGQVPAVYPAAAEIMKGISATVAPSSAVCHDIESSEATFGTKPLLVFPAKSQHIFS
jgi:hypothetical protein